MTRYLSNDNILLLGVELGKAFVLMYLKQEIIDEFVEKLPGIRKRFGLSQTDFGEKVGLSRQSISSIERKSVPLTWDTFLAMALVVLINDPDVFDEFEHPERFMEVIDGLKADY